MKLFALSAGAVALLICHMAAVTGFVVAPSAFKGSSLVSYSVYSYPRASTASATHVPALRQGVLQHMLRSLVVNSAKQLLALRASAVAACYCVGVEGCRRVYKRHTYCAVVEQKKAMCCPVMTECLVLLLVRRRHDCAFEHGAQRGTSYPMSYVRCSCWTCVLSRGRTGCGLCAVVHPDDVRSSLCCVSGGGRPLSLSCCLCMTLVLLGCSLQLYDR